MMGFCKLIEKHKRSAHNKLTEIYSIFDKYFHSGLVKKGLQIIIVHSLRAASFRPAHAYYYSQRGEILRALHDQSWNRHNNNNNIIFVIVTNIFYELKPCALLRDTLQNDIIILFSWISRVSQFRVFFF